MTRKIAPSVLEFVDDPNIGTKIDQLLDAGADLIHYDVMDGRFVPSKTSYNDRLPMILMTTRPHFKDFHLMVDDPDFYMQKYEPVAASMTFHFETVSYRQAHKLIRKYRTVRMKVGIAINPKTNVEQIYEYLPKVDMVLVMAVQPGQGGQSFDPSTLAKIKKIRDYLDVRGLGAEIQVDGGIKDFNVAAVFAAGADIVVAGTYITKSDFRQGITTLKTIT